MKNWKTTLSGLLAILPQVLHVLWPETVSATTANSLTAVFASAGLLAAKDGNVTGGTVQQ